MLLLQRGGSHKPTPRSRLRPFDHRSLAATSYILTFISFLISTCALVNIGGFLLAATGFALKVQDPELLAFAFTFTTGLLVFYICSYGTSESKILNHVFGLTLSLQCTLPILITRVFFVYFPGTSIDIDVVTACERV